MGWIGKTATRPAIVLATVLLAACIGAAGCADDGGLAAKYEGGTITEQEVTDYTAAYRTQNGYEDDAIWALFLQDGELDAKTWRERVIGTLVEERLLADKAAELGIEPDEERIASQIEQDRAVVDAQDDAVWQAYLESHGFDEASYRAQLEQTSIEQQLLLQELALDESDEDVLDSYIEDSLATRVLRRYRVLVFDDAQSAREALDDMSGLTGEELAERFDVWLERDGSDETTRENGGDIGWDVQNDLGSAQYELNEEMCAAGTLSAQVHEADGKYYVFFCTKRYEVVPGSGYAALPDDDLKAFVRDSANYALWSERVSDYVGSLREAANVQVSPMPENLPYDVGGATAHGGEE